MAIRIAEHLRYAVDPIALAYELIFGAFYLAGTAVYIIGRRDKLMAIIVAITLGLPLLLLQLGLWYNADLLLSIVGKDPTVTGRTDIWLANSRSNKAEAVARVGLYGHLGADRSPVRRNWAQRFSGSVPNAHSSYLDVTLQLGLVGLGLLLTIIAVAWRRALACLRKGVPLGWFSLMFLVGALTQSITETMLGQHQSMLVAACKRVHL